MRKTIIVATLAAMLLKLEAQLPWRQSAAPAMAFAAPRG